MSFIVPPLWFFIGKEAANPDKTCMLIICFLIGRVYPILTGISIKEMSALISPITTSESLGLKPDGHVLFFNVTFFLV